MEVSREPRHVGRAGVRQGASYATSEVTLDEVALESWDRGYDDTDTQVWGATQGPYVFIRRTALPPP